MYGVGEVWAQDPVPASNILIKVMPSGTEGTGASSVSATEGSVSTTIDGRVVTLTVTPGSGNYIKASDIVVEPLVGTDKANIRRRAPGTAERIVGTLYNHATNREPENVIYSVTGTNSAYYVFTLPEQYDGAYVTATFTATAGEIRIPSSSSITYSSSGHYILEDDVNASVLEDLYIGSQGTGNEFAGIFEGIAKPDGTFPKITGATHALFDKISGGTVNGIILKNVSISGGTNVGAICNEATGASRIYNCGVLGDVTRIESGGVTTITCSSSVSGSGDVGSIVGKLSGTSRVINCFSFASVSGGTYTGGIVGNNTYASKSGDIKTMVMNCMFYGTGSDIYPIYGNKGISNKNTEKLNNYNYFCYENLPTANIKNYNYALAAEERFLVRFEFYRYLLNSTRELAAYYVGANLPNLTGGEKRYDKSQMAKWVLDKSIAPYPILKEQGQYPSVVNYDVETAPETPETTKTLIVRLSGTGITTSSLTLPITDKDPDNYNYCYHKVQLPYFNDVGTGNYQNNKAVTGWKITSMSGGDKGTFTGGANYDVTMSADGKSISTTPYNYADRSTYDKDLAANQVYSQGAYFNVPDGVTEIYIEPYWANCVYLSDATYDKYGYDKGEVTDYGTRYVTGNYYDINGSSQKVYTAIASAIDELSSASTVYDNAVVLVGNYHKGNDDELNVTVNNNSKPFTLMSIDLDNDNEPDYSMIFRSGKQKELYSIRYDFINMPAMAMAHKTASNSNMGIPGNSKIRGWFEITNTALIRFNQFEYDNNAKSLNPLILLGGVIEQFVSTNYATDAQPNINHTTNIHLGGNVWFKLFSNGVHADKTKHMTARRPISVTGGEYETFYLSGYFQPASPYYANESAECYIDGGKFGEVAGSGQEKIDGNVTWVINHADIDEFYGGGINPDKPISGNIFVDIKNSKVDKYCGGPKFGNMADTKTVTTNADKCTFGTYFGAGNGGTALVRNRTFNDWNYVNYDGWNTDADKVETFTSGDNVRGKYDAGKGGISISYEYEHFEGSNDKTVGRFYVNYASLSTARTNDVTSSLTGCTVTGNFYGGGNLGKVAGNATSTLYNCTVNGSVFGAGYSASAPTADVFPAEGFTNHVASPAELNRPRYNTTTGVFEKGVYPTAVKYVWSNTKGENTDSKSLVDDEEGHWIHVDPYNPSTGKGINLNELGTVEGNVTLNITGNTLVEGKIFDGNGAVTAQTGGVFGGGAQSEVTGADKTVTVNIDQTGGSSTYYINNVYGGGDQGDVASEVVVNIQSESSYVLHDVFGGGNAADVKKNTEVNMTAGTVMGNIYGGGNLGDVGRIDDKSNKRQYVWTGTDGNPNDTEPYATNNSGVTHVTITGGSPKQDVFGGGKGAATSFWCEKGMVYAAKVNISNVTVGGSVYGGGELGRVETNTEVKIGPASGTDATEIKGNVFGAGQGVATHGYSALVRGNTDVTVQNGAKVDENVYGGGEIASVGKYNVDSNGMPYSLANNGSGICHVTIPGATKITGDIFGGGKGVVPDFEESGENRSKRMVNYSATTHLEGGKGTVWDYYPDDHTYVWEYFADNTAYLTYLQTLALATETEVDINPGTPESPVQSTKGNVFGGSENGIVQHSTQVTISGKCIIGEGEGKGNIYGGGKGLEGNEGAGQVSGDAMVTINSGTMIGSVYGGGVLGATKGNVTVNINGGTVQQNVYGGGALAHTNTSNWHLYSVKTGLTAGTSSVSGLYERSFGGIYTLTTDETAVADKTYYTKNDSPTWTDPTLKSGLNKTQLNLRGGTILGDAYGGALGDATHSPNVYGDILVDLNGTTSSDGITGTVINTSTQKGCVVPNVFGCNNAKGTPKGNVMVHVYATQNSAAEHIANQEGDTNEATKPKKKGRYDVTAVYGGGNRAAYNPVDPMTNKTQVIIEGCDLTSIETVYGGGNAAPVPSTDVTVNSCYEINTLFGGGNGSGTGNPGADVGIIDQTAYAADNTEGTYGPGTALAKLSGGEIHTVYGGSNEKGNIVGGANVQVNNDGDCTLNVGNIYGAGNNAEMDGGTDIVMGCMPAGVIDEIYAGARNADVAGDVKLTITSGTFGRVFGGNKHGGLLKGSITVNIEETGACEQPIIIGELYGGGNLADYSIYGYKQVTEGGKTVWKPRESASDAGTGPTTPYADPKLNVRAFTSIGAIYGGGYRAKMVANPTVDINVVKGSHATGTYASTVHAAGTIANIPLQKKDNSGAIVDDGTTTLNYPAHEAGKIGAIGNVFGGGNLAEIIGNATVNIGSEKKIYFKTEPTQFRDPSTPDTPLTPVTEGTYAGLYEATVEGAIITGSVYGGGNEAAIYGDAHVNICAKEVTENNTPVWKHVQPGTAGVTIAKDVFGAGKGVDNNAETALVSGDTKIVMFDGTVKQSVYGGGELSQVGGSTNIIVNGGTIGTPAADLPSGVTPGAVYGNVYGGGQGNTTDIMTGLIKGNTVINIGSFVADADYAAAHSDVSEGDKVGPQILHNIYGGGAHGSVGTFTYADDAYHASHTDVAVGTILGLDPTNGAGTGATSITIKGGKIGTNGKNNGMVFGSSRGDIDRPGEIYDRLAWVYSTSVVIGGDGSNPDIRGSVYGSGENGHTYQNASVAIHSGMVGVATSSDETDITVTEGGKTITYKGAMYPYRGNVYGGGCGTDKYYTNHDLETHDGNGQEFNIKAGIVGGTATVLIDGGHVVRDVYGGGSMGAVDGTTNVTIGGNAIIGAENSGGGYVFAACRGDQDNPDKATVSGTTLNINGGTIWESAFGGGQNGVVKGSVAVNVTGGEVKKDVYGGGALADTNTDNWDADERPDLYVAVTGLTVDTSPVTNYYTRGGTAPSYTYTKITDESAKAQANTIYYNKTTDSDGDWASTPPNSGAYYTTKVEVSGGTVGNVYGGGLGRLANGDDPTANGYIGPIKAMVYGDVTVTINGSSATGATNDAKFTQNYEPRTFTRTVTDATNQTTQQSVTENYYTTGRVFGCNNINGTPKGNVNVTVWRTTPLSGGSHIDGKYEIQEVYGGGNLSAYTPAEGKKTEVHIHGCDDTSIFYVFGGGNAATVPETDVNIHGCREIETVFGGGNGNEPVKNYSGQWVESNGADVPGVAKLSLMGGLIHSAFAGSFVKGTCGVTVLDDKNTTGSDGCTLKVTNMYGGGKDAPVVSGININISGCSADNDIENIYAGSYNARISTGVTMNITGGVFKRVFGGNHQGGFINGPIDINIEETDKCKPIIIENLYGGGNLAPYPGPGTNVENPQITINIKSCTHIGKVFGGGYGINAIVTGNTELNINMMKGNWAGAAAPLGHSSLPNIHQANYAKVMSPVVGDIGSYYEKSGDTFTKTSDVALNDAKTYYVHYDSPIDVIDDAIGTIGNVYGGGDLGAIDGNTIINIGNATQVGIMKRNASGEIVDESGNLVYNSENGMLIAGKEIAYVNKPVLGANITGDVYGGGNEADVTGTTYVNISALMTPVANSNPITYTYEKVNHSNTANFEGLSIGGSVYGGGCEADVLGNTFVTMEDGYVFNGIFGGGYSGSVGTVTAREDEPKNYDGTAHTAHPGCIGGKPTAFATGTGKCTVVVNGGQIGPDEVATENNGMNRITNGKLDPVPQGWVWGAGCGVVTDPANDLDADFRTYVKETDVTIGGTAFIMESVIGGGEFGRVFGNTKVTIKDDCQIGAGYKHIDGSGKPIPYTTALWTEAATAVTTGSASDINTVAGKMSECSHFPYGRDTNSDGKLDEFLPYDPYYNYSTNKIGTASTELPSDGKTWIGCVFGGGSGYMPYKKTDNSDHIISYDWIRSAGLVEGNTYVIIKGGHILTNVYGGNEYTDVKGKCNVIMSGGTIGVPRTLEQIAKHPVTCYLFGAGKGDQRSHFNDYTNVGSVEVKVSGGIIYGSVFGGSEDGHVLGDVNVIIKDSIDATNSIISSPIIGTWGTSYVDGNVFGGGRGFSGENLIAGSVGGNAKVTISGGTMLGSIYGGGRMASVGIDSSIPTNNDFYGQLVDDTSSNTYGHITINISGGTVGGGKEGSATDLAANYYDMRHSGNVFGGSMGRIEKLDGTTNDLWPKLAVVKTSSVSISDDADIKNTVYGGGEIGIVRNQATVNVSSGTVEGSVFGGGYGSDNQTTTTINAGGYASGLLYTFTPMKWAGCVSGNTTVSVSGGTVKKNVYGGGEMASVGLINYNVVEDANGLFTYKDPSTGIEKKYSYSSITKHDSHSDDGKEAYYDFGLSWPYEYEYIAADPASPTVIGGKATVSISGTAKIGTKNNSGVYEDNTGYVFGGSKGKVWFGANENAEQDITKQRYTEAFMANVRETEVTINGGTMRTVCGGGEDGHVHDDTKVTINSGSIIDNSVYGGGKGKSTYKAKLWDPDTKEQKASAEDVHSWTAGRVYGNTEVIMNGGSVGYFVYGGGNMASVGKGNYTGGSDDYSTGGYGELPSTTDGAIWTATPAEGSYAYHFQNSGKSTVTILGGTVGPDININPDAVVADADKDKYVDEDGIPYGSVFGGSRGKAAMSVSQSPRYRYMPDFFLGYVNKAIVNIGGTKESGAVGTAGPTIRGSIYGGAQDGHVRNNTEVRIFKGSITGQGNYEPAKRSGNVFGAGSGIGKYTGGYMNNSSGSVTCTTLVEVSGDPATTTIAGNVYGGGALASVGPYRPTGASSELHAPTDEHKSCSYTKVDIKGGAIGGSVYGASRGPSESFLSDEFAGVYIPDPDNPTTPAANQYNQDAFATDIWSDVTISGGTIAGNVYGGGEGGRVTESTSVILTGGVIGTASAGGDVYGSGKGTEHLAANVGGNTSVELNPGLNGSNTGCVVRRIFGCNDLNGTPKGHASVHVYATQNRNKTDNPDIETKYEKYGNVEAYTPADYTTYTYEGNTLEDLATDVGMTSEQITAYKGAITNAAAADKAAKIEEWREAISVKKYDVLAVYGGGNLAPYEPANINSEVASVVIDGCQLTSIKQVYGGGNAAFVPGTSVRVNEAYEIDEVFGGGNGKDPYQKANGEGVMEWYQNPGANVGYSDFTHQGTSGVSPGSAASPYYLAIDNDDATDADPIVAKTKREKYKKGSGVATTNILGGRLHIVYGGSNKRGNISNMVLSVYQESGTCDLVVDHSYGAGKDAQTDAEPVMKMDCVGYMERIFGGSTNADVYNDIVLNISNGKYGEVYGGNDRDGAVYGSITVNIEEGGCLPIHIDNLYVGGYMAPYSKYGYEKNVDGTYKRHDVTKKLIPLTTGSDPANDPIINVISASYIGNIYGGGYQAALVGNPYVNVNMKAGRVEVVNKGTEGSPVWKDNEGKASTAQVTTTTYPADVVYDEKSYNISDNGLRVDVDRLEMTTALEADLTTQLSGTSENEADYKETEDAKTYVYQDITGKFHKVSTIIKRDRHWAALDLGFINNSVYGGGNEADIIGNTYVEIGTGEWITSWNDDGTPHYESTGTYVTKYVDGAPVYSTDVRKAAVIKGNVYGGGKMGHVGYFTPDDDDTNDIPDGKPISCATGTGTCNVTISHGSIGPDDMIMTKDGGPDDAGHVFGAGQGTVDLYWNDETGMTDVQKQTAIAGLSESALAAKITAVDNLAYANKTEVVINGDAFIKGSVYGGSENGHVLGDTHVTIDGNCQIGNGYVQMADNGTYLASPLSMNRPYTSTEWEQGKLIMGDDDRAELKTLVSTGSTAKYSSSLPECASWPYQSPYEAHDKFAATTGYDSKGGAVSATNGHTFYGSVFGGGSGYFPYAAGKWHWKAGNVGGNTLVEIKGGHVLTNVYGGNEMTNVDGKATVRMTGGTIGVPRTLGQITKHPVTCYLFGGGAGDPRVLFNKQTNVQDAEVSVTGGWVYGSVFGGAEDGHVMRNVDVTIGGTAVGSSMTKEEAYAALFAGNATKIGTWGTSYVDGNIFGGGRGFSGDAYTAGNVAGSITMTINGGTMLGSVYGGGRLGSVGYGLYESTETDGNNKYGMMQEDGYGDYYLDNGSYKRDAITGFKRGHVDITISGGTIGNDYEYKYIAPGTTIDASYRSTNNIPFTEFDTNNRLLHAKGGNVYAGGMGRMTQLDGTTPISAVDWWKLGNVKTTKLTITGNDTKIYGNVYGGCELGMVQGTHTSADSKDVSTEIIISGGTIGTEIKETIPGANVGDPSTTVTRYTFGSVFAGGYGSIVEKLDHTGSTNPTYSSYAYTYPKYIAGRVKGGTEVTMTGGAVKASVFGGGDMAAVGESKVQSTSTDPVVLGETLTGAEGKARDGDTYVNISGGTIGIAPVGGQLFGGATMGNVYGGGSGYINTVRSGQIYGSTNVTISGTPTIYHNVYGGGAYGTVGDFTYEMQEETVGGVTTKKVIGIDGLHTDRTSTGTATVTITGGTIGVDGNGNGMVYGSSRGAADEPGKRPDWLAWVYDTDVTIGKENDATSGPLIKGSVYGGGENGHNYHNADVKVHSGTIGTTDVVLDEGAGCVFGGGSGVDTYWKDDGDGVEEDGEKLNNPTTGIVQGNTTVTIDGGHVIRSVYGGGNLGSVGTITNTKLHDKTNSEVDDSDLTNGFGLSWPCEFTYAANTGKATVNITGGRIGLSGKDYFGPRNATTHWPVKINDDSSTTDLTIAEINDLEQDNGDVYGGSRGKVKFMSGHQDPFEHHREEAELSNVRETEVNVEIGTDTPSASDIEIIVRKEPGKPGKPDKRKPALKLKDGLAGIAGSVYGGGEDGHVYEKTDVKIKRGYIGHAVYGGGKGKGTFVTTLRETNPPYSAKAPEEVISMTAGKIYGNTNVTMSDGWVMRNIYGGGNLGSVGKGNYSGGDDDYSQAGYGETLTGKLWDEVSDNSKAFMNSGKATVKVTGGRVGFLLSGSTNVYEEFGSDSQTIDEIGNGFSDYIKACSKDDLPTGNVFGGCRGQAAMDVGSLSPRYQYAPDFYLGYLNETEVEIGDASASNGPRIFGSVYGGGQDGHVRRNATVTIKKGEIGIPYTTTYTGMFGDLKDAEGKDNLHWLHRGNVYGAGSGIGTYEDSSGDHPGTSSGSVTCHTTVNIESTMDGSVGSGSTPGNIIHRNVYGGGSLASVGPPYTGQVDAQGNKLDPTKAQSINTVNIAGMIGTPDGYVTGFKYDEQYGGEVYGASRGDNTVDLTKFATSIWTLVKIKDGATIMGNVFGGGDAGKVKKDTDVIVGAE